MMPSNAEEVKAFQRRRTNHLGKPLKQDGDIGPETQWALDVDSLGDISLAIWAAVDQVGLIEVGTNRGPEIDRWVLRCGVPLGSAWCAAFVSMALSHLPGVNLHEASVARLARLLPETDSPLVGDVFFWLNEDGTGHCGLIIGTDGDDILTCEGNSENGVRVWVRAKGNLRFLSTRPQPRQPGIPGKAKLTRKARGGQTR
jgi:hypothetical protein